MDGNNGGESQSNPHQFEYEKIVLDSHISENLKLIEKTSAVLSSFKDSYEHNSLKKSSEKRRIKSTYSKSGFLCTKNLNDIYSKEEVLEVTPNYETKLERMIKSLIKTKNKLIFFQDNSLADEIDWIINTLLNNELNDIEVKIQHEGNLNFSFSNVEKTLELLSEYSSELKFKQNIEKFETALEKKRKELTLSKLNLEKANIESYMKEEGIFIKYPEIFTKEFDILSFKENVGKELTFSIICANAFERFSILGSIDKKVLVNFLDKMNSSYNNNPYHNSLHGADVTQSCSMFLQEGNMKEVIELDNIDILSFIVAALSHDVGHPGLNNGYHINSRAELALIYNDVSVLENYHISITYKNLQKPEFNIFAEFGKEEYNILRKRIINCILATDMSCHTKLCTNMKMKITNNEVDMGKNTNKLVKDLENKVSKFDAKQEILSLTLHAADLGHNTKKFKVTQTWAYMLSEEFWLQGDLEKKEGLPISFLCDRTTANIPKSQIGFIREIIIPCFQILEHIFPGSGYLVQNAKDNMEGWGILDQENEKRNEQQSHK